MKHVLLLSCGLFLCGVVAVLGMARVACVCVYERGESLRDSARVHLRGWAGQGRRWAGRG